MAISYGRTIRWTYFDGSKTSVGVSECASFEEATIGALEEAIKSGWTAPRWWQFWRWNDTSLKDLGL